MKGLLIKDSYALFKQMKIFLLVILFWSCLPNFAAAGFAVVYAALLPITAIAYDERSKWDQLAAMMPYSPTALVLSKYVLGYLLMLATALVACAARAVTSAFGIDGAGNSLPAIALSLCGGLLLLAVVLPLMFQLGVEKGRFLYMLLFAAVVVAAMLLLKDRDLSALTAGPMTAVLLPAALLVAIALNLLSIAASIGIYRRKR